MSHQPKPLDQQIIVITGATSGIGLATARAAAKAGARLVLAARSEKDLRAVAGQLEQAGAHVTTVAADVAKPADVARIAEAARSHFGGFDTWVNNAGVGIFGRIEDGNAEDHRRLFETNFWGIVNGSLEALKHFKAHGGALINLGSVVSDVAIPMQGMYSASKHAVKGFTDALRIELEHEEAPVTVTLIKPASIDTPFNKNVRNYTDYELQLPPPVYAPEEVANAILYAAVHPTRDIYVGGGGKVMSTFNKHAPGVMDWISAKAIVGQEKSDKPAANPAGGLQQPGLGGHAHSDYPGHVMKSYYTRTTMNPLVAGALAAAGLAVASALITGNFSWGKLKDAGVRIKELKAPEPAPAPAKEPQAAATTNGSVAPKDPQQPAIPQSPQA
ncbi:SDR family oxidoreductase [Hymenobacter coccineus]|uniref:Short-chain dehydrogenase n=1 Tax=Hymenobacter coccineus TaxID=1908235 RepID=A0A1G1SZU2_9BACT|nr:SDR family oxidoreductase [Hymenobacter coccineus]OGX84150.1 short-chain dehydrogenase [Hymenobacter coccineus]